MAVVLQEYTRQSTEGTASSITLAKPANVAVGDFLMLLLGNENSAAGEGFDQIAGWTRAINAGDGTSDCYTGVFWRFADGTEDATVVVPFLGNDDGHGWYARLTGVDTVNPITSVATQIVVHWYATASGMTPTRAGSVMFSLLAFDGSDMGIFYTDQEAWVKQDQLDSPTGSDSGGASAGAFAKTAPAGASLDPYPSFHWLWNDITDGTAHTQFEVKAGIPPQYGSATLSAQSTVSCEGSYENNSIFGSATLSAQSTVSCEGEYVPPIYGSASLVRSDSTVNAAVRITFKVFGAALLTSSSNISATVHITFKVFGAASLTRGDTFEVAQTVLFLTPPYPILGAAHIISSSTITLNGTVFGGQLGQASLFRATSTIDLATVHFGSITLTRQATFNISGITTTPSIGSLMTTLEDKVTAIEQLINEAPSGTDFLTAEDIRSFFTATERGVLYGI